MKKRLFLTVLLLTSLLSGVGFSSAWAEAKIYVIWCEGNTTLYFLSSESNYADGGTYKGQTITNVWQGSNYYKYKENSTVKSSCTTAVIESSLKSSGFNSCSEMFKGFTALTSVSGVSNALKADTWTASQMFQNCSELTTIDFTGVNTGNVYYMDSMFAGCSKLTSLDLSMFDTSKVESMYGMFDGCSSLISLNISQFNTENVTTMVSMFDNCQKLTSLNVASFNTAKVENMQEMFKNCQLLSSLDVTSFNTSEVTNMIGMFSYCRALTSLNLSRFDVSKVADMTQMFYYDDQLVTINSNNNWNHAGLTSTNMFAYCSKLKGHITYSGSCITAEYANPTTGYFTETNQPVMNFSATTKTITVGESYTLPTLSTEPSGLSVTYSSSDETVATVDETTGAVTPLHSGTTTITASFAGNADYRAHSASYTLTVSAKSFDLSLCGKQMNSDYLVNNTELTTALGTSLTDGTLSLAANDDYSALTLSLNGAKLISDNYPVITNSGTLSVVATGSCELTCTYSINTAWLNDGNLTLSGSGQMTVNGQASGIENNSYFTMTGGTLEIAGGTGFFGSNTSVLTVSGGKLKATGSSGGSIVVSGEFNLGDGVAITQPLGAVWNSTQHAVCDAQGYPIKEQVVITKGAAASGLAYSAASVSVKYGSTTALPTLANPHSLAVTYTSSNTAAATIAANGVVTLVKPGETTITATFAGNDQYIAGSASYTLTVTKGDASLSYTPTTASVVFGGTLTRPTLTAVPASLLTDHLVTYQSSNESVATLTGVEGEVNLQAFGTTTITASFGGNDYYNAAADAQYVLTVSAAAATLTFAETACTGKVGQAFNSPTLTIEPSSTLTVKYSSSNTAIATVVESTGVVMPNAEGTVTITATIADTQYAGSASYQLTITKNDSGLAFASTTATTTYGDDFTPPALTNTHSLTVSYSSSNTAVAKVNINTGAVTILKAGAATITASFAGNSTYEACHTSYLLTVEKAAATLSFDQTEVEAKVGDTFTPSLTVSPTGLDIKYSTSDRTVAHINYEGKVIARKVGSATITATVNDERYQGTASYTVTITKKTADLSFSVATAAAVIGEMFTAPVLSNTHNLSVHYGSSDSGVASVSYTDGTVTVYKPGTVVITASSEETDTYEAGSATYTLTISKGIASLIFASAVVDAKVGVDFTPGLTVDPTGLSVVYTCSNADLATVDASNGKVTPHGEGEVTITATVDDVCYEGSASYKMKIAKNENGLAFSAATATGTVGEAFTPPTLLNEHALSVSISSSRPYVASVDAEGNVTLNSAGETVISANFAGDGVYDASTVSYTLTVSKGTATVSFPMTEVNAKIGIDIDSPTPSITPEGLVIKYSSSDDNLATVGAVTGKVSPKAIGEVTITAVVEDDSYEGSGSYTLKISKNENGLAFSAATATATYGASFTPPTLTNQYDLPVTYESSKAEVATVASDGKVTVLKAGETTISAKFVGNDTYEAGSVSYLLTVNPKTVSNPTITLSATSFVYDGSEKKPTVTVKDGSTTIPAEEYTVGYKNNTEAGTATVTITDNEGGNYTVSGSTTFEITSKDDPSTDEPSTDDPSTDDPSTDDPSTDDPSTDDPSTDDPSTDDPSTDDPSTDDPSTDDPSTDEPTTEDVPVTISGAKQVPYYSEYNLDFTNLPELKAYVATGYDKAKGTIWLTRVKQVPAETGFLLMGDPGDYDIPTIDGVSDVYYKNMFKGTLEGTTLYTTDGDYTNYYLSKGDAGVGFYKVTKAEGVKVGANRCFLPILTEIPVEGSTGDTELIKVSAAKQVPYYTSKNLDFSSLDAQGVKAYTATGYNYHTGVIWLTRVKKVPAQTGILVMADKSGDYNVPTTTVQSVYENMFVGSETAQTIYTNEEIGGVDYVNYYLSKGDAGVGFYKVTNPDGVKMGANRCYLPIPKRDAASGARGKSGESSFCQMILSDESNDDVIAIPVFGGMNGEDDGTTGIDIQSSIFNLQSNEVYYNLQGQRVENPRKGIYIHNGRRVVIK